MADPLITELDIRRALDGLYPHKGAGHDGLFPKVLKALYSHIAPVLARMFNLSNKLPRSLEIGAAQKLLQSQKHPAQQTRGN